MTFIDFHTHRKTAEGVVTPRSFGIHPWHASAEKAASYEEFANCYRDNFAFAEIVGECGLDKVCTNDWNAQMRLFRWQIRIATELEKPMVIHCVRATNELMELRRENSDGIWVIHGFTGTAQLAAQLRRAGIWVSYGAALLDPRRSKVRESLQANEGPFLLETDDRDCGIEAVYKAASETKKTDLETLCRTIKENYNALFCK